MVLRRMVKHLLIGAIVWFGAASLAMASQYHGQVTFGGLPLPGSQVTVTATQGTKKAVAISDDQGGFTFANLDDGKWSIDIEMTGFAPIQQEITVAPNTDPGKFEMKLLSLDQMRAAAKPVQVVAAPVVAAAETPAAPAPGATPAPPGAPAAKAKPGAAAPAPGAAATQAGKASGAAADAPATPSAATDTNASQASDGFLINGSVNNAATSQFSLNQAFGNNRTGGRSLYNGGLSFILDSSTLDAKQYSLSGLDSAKPSYENIFAGLTFGGPLKIPHLIPLAKAPNFFVYYQRMQQNRDSTTSALVPTAAERSGDLSAAPNVTAIYAPTSGLSAACLAAGVTPGAQFVTNGVKNVIPAACINSGTVGVLTPSQYLLNFYPQQNVSGNTQYNYQVPLTSSTHQDQFQLRMYKQFGNKNNVNGSVGLQSTRNGGNSLFGFHDASDSFGINSNESWYHRFTQRLSMNLNYTFSRSRSHSIPFFEGRENVSQLAGITGNLQDATDYGPPGLGFSSGIYGLSDGNASYNRSESNSAGGSLNWNRFRHNVQAGGDFNRREWNYLAQSNPRGSLNFNGTATNGGITTAGSDFADFLLGLPDTSAISFGNADKYLRQSTYDLYVNDDFRVNPELSINYGLRWEYGAPVTEIKDRLVNIDIAQGFTAVAPVLASNPKGSLSGTSYPTSLVRPDRIGFSPRIAFAWRPISGSSLLVRAGYGIYNDTSVYQATAMAMAQQSPLSTSLSVSNSSACAFTIAAPFGRLPCAVTTQDQFAVDPNFRVGNAQAWNLSAQRDLPAALQLVVSYLGIKGTRGTQEFLPNTYPVGGVNPYLTGTSGYVYRTSNGNSTRESGTVQLRRRLRNGLTANLSYTYSKSLDDDYSLGGQGPVSSGSISQGSSLSGQIAQDWLHPNTQRGLSTFDQRHTLAVQMQYTTGMGLGGRTLLSGWRGAAYKEWSFVANFNTGTGTPQTPVYPATVPGTGYSGIIRANYGLQANCTQPAGTFLNPCMYGAPTPGQWGNARRDSITGPNQFGFSASMARTFRLHDRYNLDTRIDASNVLNHVAYTSWNTTVGSPQFGVPASANGMRSMQVTMRLRF